jgi:hypothetical protein
LFQLTITAGLDGGLNVTDALDRNAVLVVAVNILVLKLANLVDQDTELVSDIGNIIVACLSPDRELLLQTPVSVDPEMCPKWHELTATSIRSLDTSSILRMTFFSILTN